MPGLEQNFVTNLIYGNYIAIKGAKTAVCLQTFPPSSNLIHTNQATLKYANRA